MKKVFLLLFLSTTLSFLYAQSIESDGVIRQQIEDLKKSGVDFPQASIFLQEVTDITKKNELQQIVRTAEIITLDPALSSQLKKNGPAYVTLNIPRLGQSDLQLELMEAEIFRPGFSVKTTDSNGNSVQVDRGLHFRGVVKGINRSLAAISIFDGEIAGIITTNEGNFVLGKIGNSPTAQHIFYNDRDLMVDPSFSCETDDGDIPYFPRNLEDSHEKAAGDCVGIYIEVNKDIYQDKGSVANTTNYVTAFFNQSATLYSNESIEIGISEIFIITSGNPYPQNSSSQLLSKFQQLRGSGFNGDFGHLVSYKGGGGIAAGFNGLCNSNITQSMCFSGVQSTYNNVPTYSWTVMVFTHEMGHLFGSRHTHACVWNGNNTAIDGCYTTEGSCSSPAIPSGGGTIMSYCHLQSVGINFNNGFGPQPGDLIRGNVAAAGCLAASCGGTGNHCTNGVQDSDETGVDCGGADCAACPTCSDGIQNQGETGVDCGGPNCAACPPGSCDIPSGLSASNIKPNRAKLNWGAVSGAIDYTAQLRAFGSSTWLEGTTGGTNIQASGLSNGSPYEWRVRANCSSGSSEFSAICNFTAGDSGSGGCSASNGALLSEDAMNVFPNPARDLISIEVNLTNPEQATWVTIYDIHGKMLQRIEMQKYTNIIELNVNSLPTGIYIVRTQSGKVQMTERFVKD